MNQNIPNVTLQDITRIINHYYKENEKEEIFKNLSKYNHANLKHVYRVWASILKVSNGNFEELKKTVEIAVEDERDVISVAEYPEYSEKIGFNSKKIKESEIRQIIENDWKQYSEWLNPE